jgi:hypothetical protein
MFVIIIEFLLEFLLEFAGDLFMDLLIHGGSRVPWLNRAATRVLFAGILFGAGAVIGWFSLLFFPEAFVRSESLHGISLLVTPVLAGSAMAAIGWIRESRGKPAAPVENFAYGYVLALGMALVRFYWTD